MRFDAVRVPGGLGHHRHPGLILAQLRLDARYLLQAQYVADGDDAELAFVYLALQHVDLVEHSLLLVNFGGFLHLAVWKLASAVRNFAN